MKNLILISATIILFISSCSKDQNIIQSNGAEITSIKNVDHTIATEILRMNILKEYGGIFKQMQMFHAELFNVGMPCDSIIYRSLIEEQLPKYSLNIPLKIDINCSQKFNDRDRFYRAAQDMGTQTTNSDKLSLEISLTDVQNIYGITEEVEEEMYAYGQYGNRHILITSGISAELDPFARLFLSFPADYYDQDKVEIPENSVAKFDMFIKTNEFSEIEDPTKNFEGTIQFIDGGWTVIYDDGEVNKL